MAYPVLWYRPCPDGPLCSPPERPQARCHPVRPPSQAGLRTSASTVRTGAWGRDLDRRIRDNSRVGPWPASGALPHGLEASRPRWSQGLTATQPRRIMRDGDVEAPK